MVSNLKISDQIRETNIRFRKKDDFEAYINAIDVDYDSEDAIFKGYIYKLDTCHFNKVNQSQLGNGCDFKDEIIEYRFNNCFIPTKRYGFVKCIKFLTGQNYKKQYLDFIRNEQRRSNIMTKARFQPFRRANNNNLEYYNEDRVFPRSVTNRDRALYLYIITFVYSGKMKMLVLNKLLKNSKIILD